MIKKVPQLIKYVGNKSKFAELIGSCFPSDFDTYFEPFFGSGAVFGALKPNFSVAVDIHKPLIDMWELVKRKPSELLEYYTYRWEQYSISDESKREIYKQVVASYNSNPNPLDFLFISRSCYGGVLRYRKQDGFLSTPVGVHKAINPLSFQKRLDIWHRLVQSTDFVCGDFSDISSLVTNRSIVYCDPPYIDTQKILYGAQDFQFTRLINNIEKWKEVGAFVALSIDGSKFSGDKKIPISCSKSLFEEEVEVDLGGSMLKRFQLRNSDTLKHRVKDRLLLTNPSRGPKQISLAF